MKNTRYTAVNADLCSVVETEPNVDRIIKLSFAGGDGMSGTLRYTYQVWAEDASYEFRCNLV
jgi:hypothetical protein